MIDGAHNRTKHSETQRKRNLGHAGIGFHFVYSQSGGVVCWFSLRVDTYLCLTVQPTYMTGAIALRLDTKPILQTPPSVLYLTQPGSRHTSYAVTPCAHHGTAERAHHR